MNRQVITYVFMHLEIENIFMCPWVGTMDIWAIIVVFNEFFIYTLSWDFGAQLSSIKIIFIVLSKMASNKRERIIPIKVVSE